MGWRIHFTAEDMARIRVIPTLGPLAETMFGLWMLRRHGPKTRMGRWHDHAIGRLTPEMKPLLAVLPRDSFGVDLWSLTGEAGTIEQGLEAMLSMRPTHVRAELSYASMFGHLSAASWRIADVEGRRALARAAHASYRALVEPHWLRMRDHLNAERMGKGRLMVDNGLERLLTTLSPGITWKSPVLEIAVEQNADLYLSGRGLTLVPSLLVGERPVLMNSISHPDLPPTLVFPVAGDTTDVLDPPKRIDLTTMLGRTRAEILAVLGDGSSSAQVACLLRLTDAAADHHLSKLREAGLITGSAQGETTLYRLTSLGAKFIAGA